MKPPGPNATQAELAAYCRYWYSADFGKPDPVPTASDVRRVLVRDGLINDDEIAALAPLLRSRTPLSLRIKQRKRRWHAREDAYDYIDNERTNHE